MVWGGKRERKGRSQFCFSGFWTLQKNTLEGKREFVKKDVERDMQDFLSLSLITCSHEQKNVGLMDLGPTIHLS